MHLNKHTLTHAQTVRILWGLFALAVCAELGLAVHALSMHDVVGGGLAFTALTRDSLITLIERVTVAEL